MLTLKVKDKEYKVKFGFNCFCDTDLIDRTESLIRFFDGAEVKDDKEVAALGQIKNLMCCIRELLYLGFAKYNPVNSVQEIGDIIDDYYDEGTEEDKRSALELFAKLTNELLNEGFLGDLLTEANEETQKVMKIPQDHKKAQKK